MVQVVPHVMCLIYITVYGMYLKNLQCKDDKIEEHREGAY